MTCYRRLISTDARPLTARGVILLPLFQKCGTPVAVIRFWAFVYIHDWMSSAHRHGIYIPTSNIPSHIPSSPSPLASLHHTYDGRRSHAEQVEQSNTDDRIAWTHRICPATSHNCCARSCCMGIITGYITSNPEYLTTRSMYLQITYHDLGILSVLLWRGSSYLVNTSDHAGRLGFIAHRCDACRVSQTTVWLAYPLNSTAEDRPIQFAMHLS
jgi:hypothetical protein